MTLIRTDITQETAGLEQAGSLLSRMSSPDGDLSAFKYSRDDVQRQDSYPDEPLGITASYASITSKSDARYSLLSDIQDLMQGTRYRVSSCMHTRGTYTDLMQSGDNFYYKNVITCGSVWICPVCRQKILSGRRQEITEALKSGLTPVMVTVTLQHTRSDKLDDLVDALNKSLRRLKSGRWYQDFKKTYRVKASVSTLEIRWSRDTGWHPHKHMILFCDLDNVTDDDADLIQRDLIGRYRHLLSLSGHYASEYHGIDVRIGDAYIGDYLSKDNWSLAHEMSSTDSKSSSSSVSPFNLADMASRGDGQAYHLWMEYVKATYGKRQITWSRGGKDILGVDDKSDEDLASETPEDDDGQTPELVMSIHRDLWSYIVSEGLPGRLLEVARQGGKDAVMSYLRWIVISMKARGRPVTEEMCQLYVIS